VLPYKDASENATPRGYERKDFLDAWARYLPSPATSATSATSATNTPVVTEAAAPSAKTPEDQRVSSSMKASDLAEPDGRVAHVAHVVDFPGREGGKARSGAQLAVCVHCGRPGATGQLYRENVADGVWLHRDCERNWLAAYAVPDIPDDLRRT
jgi:hypothetical protein